jgi:hypothetical protein
LHQEDFFPELAEDRVATEDRIAGGLIAGGLIAGGLIAEDLIAANYLAAGDNMGVVC